MLKKFRKCLIINQQEDKKNQPNFITLKEFSVQLKQKSKIFIIHLIFQFCLAPDPKQIIPDPRKSSGSHWIWIHNTAGKSGDLLRSEIASHASMFHHAVFWIHIHRIWIRILSKISIRIRIQAISYHYLNFFLLLHNYKIFSSKEVY